MVDATRMGYVFAHNKRAYRSWVSKFERASGTQVALSPQALESAIMRIAKMFPENVSHGVMQ